MVHDELAQGVQLIQGLHGLFVGQHFGSVVAEVFQLTRRGVGLQRFKEALGLVQPAGLAGQVGACEQIQAPEGEPFAQGLLGHDDALDDLAHAIKHLNNRGVVPFCDELWVSGW